MDEYDIHLRGFAAEREESPAAGLRRVFGVDEARAEALVRALPRVVKRHVPEDQLPRYAQALGELGADFEIRRSAIVPKPIVAVVGAAAREAELDSGLSLPPPPAERRAPAPRHAATVMGRSGELACQRLVAGHERTEVSPPPRFDEPAPLPVPPREGTSRTIREAPPQPSAPAPTQRTQPLGTELSPLLPAFPHAPPPAPSYRPPAPELPPARELSPLPLARAAPPSARPPVREVQAQQPLSLRPDDRVYNVWAPLEPKQGQGAPGARPIMPASVPATAPAVELDIGGRPAWLVDGRGALRADALSQSLTELGGAPVDPWRAQVELSAAASLDAPLSAAPASRAPGPASVPPAAIAQVQTRPRAAHAVGVHAVPSQTVSEPPAGLRWLLRIGLGLSMFMLLAMFRHCRAFDSDVQEQVASWGEQPALARAAPSGAADAPKTLGPAALTWLESDLNQVTSGDKDAVRAKVQRFLQAGALQVYMGNVMRSGPMQIAGELVIALPNDPERRKRVLKEHGQFMDSAFAGFAAERPDPGGDYLRVTL